VGGGRRSGAVGDDGEARRERTSGELEQRAAARGERQRRTGSARPLTGRRTATFRTRQGRRLTNRWLAERESSPRTGEAISPPDVGLMDFWNITLQILFQRGAHTEGSDCQGYSVTASGGVSQIGAPLVAKLCVAETTPPPCITSVGAPRDQVPTAAGVVGRTLVETLLLGRELTRGCQLWKIQMRQAGWQDTTFLYIS
jgi:hypothetical protein